MSPGTNPIRWSEDRDDLVRRLAAPSRLLVASDFDGTLAPIAATPDEARLPGATLALLAQIAALPGVRVAIVSGRSIRDLADRVPIPGILLVGNHGLEMRGLGLDGERAAARSLRADLDGLLRDVGCRLADVPGVLVENKGLTGSVHYRNVPPDDTTRVTEAVHAVIGTHEAFEVHHGKKVWDVKPRLSWHKGSALRQILQRLGQPESTAVYLGDDTTDESAFAAMPNALTLFVGPPHPTAARWRADDCADALSFLEWLFEIRSNRCTGRR
jgi:trehalose-phosphatase